MPDEKKLTKAEEEAASPVEAHHVRPDLWWHDVDHGSTQERQAAQKARDEAAGFGEPAKEPE